MKELGADQFFRYPTSLTSVYAMDADGKNVKRLQNITLLLCNPLAPEGAGGASSTICGAPSPS